MVIIFLSVAVYRILLCDGAAALLMVSYHLWSNESGLENSCAKLRNCSVQHDSSLKQASMFLSLRTEYSLIVKYFRIFLFSRLKRY